MTDDTRYIKGQTKFFCDNHEQHATVYIEIYLYRCVSHTSLGCDDGAAFVNVGHAAVYCYNAQVCQRTVTTTCDAHRLYWAEGRFAAWNTSGDLVHQSSHWSNLTSELEWGAEGEHC